MWYAKRHELLVLPSLMHRRWRRLKVIVVKPSTLFSKHQDGVLTMGYREYQITIALVVGNDEDNICADDFRCVIRSVPHAARTEC